MKPEHENETFPDMGISREALMEIEVIDPEIVEP